ncbi:MAG: glycine betaine/L-proline ABC transporter ATP-binding protein [Spirochaetaceae bacterium]|nr:glycine betaine/L-proline ABC transporter ATP-binding protein [Spirochaetaceae bacterium]
MSDVQKNEEGAASAAPSSSDTIIEVKDLWKVYGRDPKRILTDKYRKLHKDDIQEKTGNIVAMREVNLKIKKGEFYIIMGLSGSGKSTLVRNLIRLVNPTAGKITVKGRDVTKMKEDELLDFRKTTYGMVFQHYGLMPHMTILDNAAYGLKVRGLPKGEQLAKAMKALETVGLKGWEDYYPGNLSGGMQQRVGLARALANDPDILLMDEPFSGLDPLIRRQMQDEFVDLQDKLKKTIVFVTHDLHEALKLGDKIAIMRNGEVVQIGTPEEIVTQPANDYVREFVQDASPAKVVTAGTIMREPEVLLYAWEGPKTALTILQREKRRGAFVVDKGHKLLGLANVDRLEKYLKGRIDVDESKISSSVVRPIPSVTEETIIEELFSMVSANPYPIPVTSEDNKLLGVVKTDDIFETISPDGGEDDV